MKITAITTTLKWTIVVTGWSLLSFSSCSSRLNSIPTVHSSSAAMAQPDSNSTEMANAVTESVNGAPASEALTAMLTFDDTPNCWLGEGPSYGSCSGSAQTASYTCAIGNWKVTGTSTLTFNNASCSIGQDGTSVTRTMGLEFAHGSLGDVTINSDNFTDYRGNTIGGGQVMSVDGSGDRTYAILGVHSVGMGPFGIKLFDIGSRTIAPLTVSGSGLGSLAISGGSLEVIHDTLQYVSTWTADAITWGSVSCACPTSGSLSGTLTGSITGSMMIEYTSTCGQANVTLNGVTSAVALDFCASN